MFEKFLNKLSFLFKKDRPVLYVIICGMISTHFFYILYFRNIGSTFMSVFNIFSTLFYAMLLVIFKHHGNPIVLKLAFYEICIHAFCATAVVGSGNGFEIFIICAVFASFNLVYITRSNKTTAFIMVIFAFALLFGVRFLPEMADFSSIRVFPNPRSLELIFIFNSFIAFAMIGATLIVFFSYIRSDKEKLTQQNYKLAEMAYMDSLTQLLNRRAMKLRLEAALEVKKNYDQEFVIAIVDVDDFKQINDSYGHDCGDTVLKNVVRIIKENVRATDYVSRWGGDEILILFNKSTLSGAMSCIERIHKQASCTEFTYNGNKLIVTLTIGVCQSENYYMYQDVILEADRRLYEGKHKGKNCIVYESSRA
jgi:diguanylate cyclase (GGDEF)-like protein